jgi:hypothetical protein
MFKYLSFLSSEQSEGSFTTIIEKILKSLLVILNRMKRCSKKISHAHVTLNSFKNLKLDHGEELHYTFTCLSPRFFVVPKNVRVKVNEFVVPLHIFTLMQNGLTIGCM